VGKHPVSNGDAYSQRYAISTDGLNRVICDIIRLRNELKKHDFTDRERHDLMTSAMPAFIMLEAPVRVSE
jgi:hypothetical protein